MPASNYRPLMRKVHVLLEKDVNGCCKVFCKRNNGLLPTADFGNRPGRQLSRLRHDPWLCDSSSALYGPQIVLHLVYPPSSLRTTYSCNGRIVLENHFNRVAIRHPDDVTRPP